MIREQYAATANELVKRIVALGPQVLEIDSPWDLFKAGLECKDLDPSLGQAWVALDEAKRILRSS